LIFTGERFDAAEGKDWGLISKVVPRGAAPTAAGELASEVCRSSPIAVRAAKSSIDAALGVPIEDGIEIEHRGWENVIASEDRLEGIAAFNDKRVPDWKNR
jgi:enoyl-CoA hydratase/carnithine racemase